MASRKIPKSVDEAPQPATTDPVAEVAQWILDGQSRADIVGGCRELLGIQDAGETIAAAWGRLALGAGNPAQRHAFHVEARRELYRRCLEWHDYKTAETILRDLAKLEGMYPGPAQRTATPSEPSQSADNAFPSGEDAGVPEVM